MDLKTRWKELCARFCTDKDLVVRRFKELNVAYSGNKRMYHNLSHITFMLSEYDKIKAQIVDQDAFQFAVFYHDIIYNIKRKDNEEKSAELGVDQLNEMGMKDQEIRAVKEMILATKTHEVGLSNDVNLLVDVDMAILGQSWDSYLEYTTNIRGEYKIYPDFMYKKGRREVLKRFLEMNQIFKTDLYNEKYEAQAKKNIQKELELLS